MPPSGDQLQLQRHALRRGLWRASLASIVVLLVVVALAVGVAWKARQSQAEAERARLATDRAESELWNAKLNEARARRIAGRPGARVESAALVRSMRSLERAERLATSERERLFTERLARQYDLLKRLRGATQKPNISQLADDFRVDRRTIRRDLHDLVNRHQLPPVVIKGEPPE